MVKDFRQQSGLPDVPPGLPSDDLHVTANVLHSAALRLLRMAREADVGMSLDGPRASALSVLTYAGPQPMTRLAAIEQVSPPAITKVVTALEADGLVTRTTSPTDGRVVIAAVTPKGRRLLERGRAARVRAVADRMAVLSDRDQATLRRAAQLMERML